MSSRARSENIGREFESIPELLAIANEGKTGDELTGIAAESDAERIAAKKVLSKVTLETLRTNPVVPYEEDEVTRVIQDAVRESVYERIRDWTVADLREFLLDEETDDTEIRAIRPGLTSEMIAAVTKIMSNMDLILAASKMTVTAQCNNTIGTEGTLSFRLQPNDPADDIENIINATREGLSYGVGDAVIGVNPVSDDPAQTNTILEATKEFMEEWNVPTQNCCLAHVTTQMDAIQDGAPADLLFQSIAGTEAGNEEFGIDRALLEEAHNLAQRRCSSSGPNVMYFETGQGSELSGDAHEGIDQLTLEARCYGLAREYDPFIVNTVVGFIGPEYLYDGKPLFDAYGVEDGVVVGVSVGGFMALRFALTHPDYLDGLVLADAPAGPQTPNERENYRDIIGHLRDTEHPSESLARQIAERVTSDTTQREIPNSSTAGSSAGKRGVRRRSPPSTNR